MKKSQPPKRKQSKKQRAFNRKAKQISSATEQTPPAIAPLSPARKAFQDL